MINARLNEIMQDDDELFNRIRAYGPGDGINRVSVVVEDATSISTYGLRETTETFLDATSRSDLETKATEFLNEKKDPVTQVSLTLFLDENMELAEVAFDGETVTIDGEDVTFYGYGEYPDIIRGDTIRIVSQELQLNTTGVVQELDWEPGQVTLTVGKGNYNLLDVINGPREDAERERAPLGSRRRLVSAHKESLPESGSSSIPMLTLELWAWRFTLGQRLALNQTKVTSWSVGRAPPSTSRT
jgi:hypothetical protein